MTNVAEKPEGGEAGKPRRAKYWHSQLEAAKKREEDWHNEAKEVTARYDDDRKNYAESAGVDRKINILWSNTEIQKGSLFANLGNPEVRRQFPKPGNANKVARTAATVIENTMKACNNRYNPEDYIRDAVENQVLQGRGQCWLEYEPTIGEVHTGDYDDEGTPVTKEAITYQDVKICYVDYCDFRHGPGKKWEDVPWVARPHLMAKDDLKQFGEYADKISLNYVLEEGYGKEDQGDFKRARVWEIWFKRDKVRIYIADDFDFELKRDDDPYKLECFFPCPKPLYAVKRAGTLRPRPEYLQWQDQAAELDRVNSRIYNLLEKLRYCGVYDGSNEDSDALANVGKLKDGEFIPFKNFQSLAQGGGLAAAFQVRDLKPIAETIQALSQRAIELIQSIYEITGISDILRGSSDANETASAQQIKQQSGSQRLQLKQKEVQRFVKDLYRMKGEIIAEHFEREQLENMSGVLLPLAMQRDQAKQTLQQFAQQQQAMAQAAQQAQQVAQQQSAPQGSQSPSAPQGQGPAPTSSPLNGGSGQQPSAQPSSPPQQSGPPMPMPSSAPPSGGQGLTGSQMQSPHPGLASSPLGLPPQQPPMLQLSPDQIQELQLIADACSWEEISEVLRSDDRRNYNINIETDSTAFADDMEEKAQRIEFTNTMVSLIEKVFPAIQANPSIKPFMKEVVLFTSRAFKAGRQLEEALEDTFDQIASAPAPSGPSPEQVKLQAEVIKLQAAKMKAEAETAKAQAEAQSRIQEMQGKLMDAQQSRQLEMTDMQMKREKDMLDLQLKKENVELNKLETLLKLKKLGLDSRAQALAEYESMNGTQDMHERRAADIQGQQQDHELAVHDANQSHAIEHRKIDAQEQKNAHEAALRRQKASQPQAA